MGLRLLGEVLVGIRPGLVAPARYSSQHYLFITTTCRWIVLSSADCNFKVKLKIHTGTLKNYLILMVIDQVIYVYVWSSGVGWVLVLSVVPSVD